MIEIRSLLGNGIEKHKFGNIGPGGHPNEGVINNKQEVS